jgi:hypothetical protein
LTLASGETHALDFFVPLAPSPTRVELDYAAGGAEGKLNLDVHLPLDGLHLPVRAAAAPR